MSDIGKILLDEIEKEHRKVTFSIFRDLVLANPVANPELWQNPVPGYVGGYSRANWQLLTQDSLAQVPDGAGQSIGPILAEGKSNLRPGADTYYIVNNAPYIEALNNGWSKQAPKKFVETAIKRNTK